MKEMSVIISHRGNLNGPDPSRENNPQAIDECINMGYKVEVDLWNIQDTWYLSHDYPDNFEYEVTDEWLYQRSSSLYIHCKNIAASLKLMDIANFTDRFNYFFHENDECVLTSFRQIWCYPGVRFPENIPFTNIQPVNGISVMKDSVPVDSDHLDAFFGVCTDYPTQYTFK